MRFSYAVVMAFLASSVSANIRGLQYSSSPAETRDLSSKTGCMAAMRGKKSKGGRDLFQRIASFPICSQIDYECDTDEETVAEIVAASGDGYILIYTDSEQEQLGLVDISDPENPVGVGTIDLDGEPTSVAVKGDYALVAINTSADFINVSGQLDVVDIHTRETVRTIDLGGQPDSVAVSPDGKYCVVAIENERDESLDDGELPQAPPGFLVVIDTSDHNPTHWTKHDIDLTGFDDDNEDISPPLFPKDPEPEFVSISSDSKKAVVTLQENNHIVIVDLKTLSVERAFSAGTVDLKNVDLTEDRIIDQTESKDDIRREPDGVAFIGNNFFATADEGDFVGGSRGFTIYDIHGEVKFTSGNDLELLAARLGHYPEDRSENKGNEPENVTYGQFGRKKLLFVNSERSSLVFVYDVNNPYKPELLQILPAGVGPEGGLVIPKRNLLVVASEIDDRGDKIRSVLNIYEYGADENRYPTIVSDDREDARGGDKDSGIPIPWGALSGLAAHTSDCGILYSVHDSFYKKSRIFVLSTDNFPARITKEIFVKDPKGMLASITQQEDFPDLDLDALINDDNTVNLDLEGIATRERGGFWLVSEGAGTFDDATRPITSLNFLLQVNMDGLIQEVVTLPPKLNAVQRRFGFEGVAEARGNWLSGKVVVVFQREWDDELYVRIGLYDPDGGTWDFVFYELDAVESLNKGWVGLSDIAPIDNGQFIVLERDNQAGPDAAIKRLYTIDLVNICFNEMVLDPLFGNMIPVIDRAHKNNKHDLIPHLSEPGGLVVEKVEGLAVTGDGDVWIVNDNDGVDDNSGETQLIQTS